MSDDKIDERTEYINACDMKAWIYQLKAQESFIEGNIKTATSSREKNFWIEQGRLNYMSLGLAIQYEKGED